MPAKPVAQGKTPPHLPSSAEQGMPPYRINASELAYPGEGSPFTTAGPGSGRTGGPHHAGTPAHPAAPWTEVPRNKVHPGAAATVALLQSLTDCATACERCIDGCKGIKEARQLADCLATARACRDICMLLHSYASATDRDGIVLMALDLSPVCARVCEACALACSRHPDLEYSVACESASRACSEACRSFAR